MENENSPKIFNSQPQTNTNFAHFHISMPAGFIVFNDTISTPETGEYTLFSANIFIGLRALG
jgi:hypothetical protein